MDVGVDQAGHEGRVPKIDGFHSGGVLDGRAGGDDLFPLNQDLAGETMRPPSMSSRRAAWRTTG